MQNRRFFWSILAVCLILTITLESTEVSDSNLLAMPVQSHPRLFLDTSDLTALRASAETTHREIWVPIRDYVDSQLGTAPPQAAPPDGDLNTYRGYGDQLIPLAFACVITGQSDYCDLAETYLLTYAAWDQWGEDDRRGLGLAHMLQGNAVAYDWLYGWLSPSEREVVRESLGRWAQEMYEASAEPGQVWWQKSYVQNFYWITHGALGMAGLALLGEDERAGMWVDQAVSKLSRGRDMLNGMQDGTWHEGIPYQSYALEMSLPFMVNVRRIRGTDILPHAYLGHYPFWRIYNHLPDSRQFIMSYGDFEWSWIGIESHLLRFVAHEYESGYAEWMAQQLIETYSRNGESWSAPWYVFEFLYYDPSVALVPPTGLKKAYVFSDLEGIVWRTGWGKEDLVFGLKAGIYGGRFAFDTFTQEIYPWEPPCTDTDCQLNIDHDHGDTNGFYIHRKGQWLAPESEGVGKRATAFHNTLLIDGQGQYMPPDDYYGERPEDFVGSDGYLEATASTPSFDYVAADATRRYKDIPGLEDVTRHVVFVRPDYFVMLDNLAAGAPHQYDWVCHFGESVSVEANWVRGNADDGQILGVAIAAPSSFEANTGDDGHPYVRVRPASILDDVRFAHVLYPTDDTSWNSRPNVAVLGDSGKAIAVRVQMNDGSGRIDDVLLTYVQPISTTTVSSYRYDGQVAVVTRGADERLEKQFSYGGTFLTDQAIGKVLATNLDRNNPFEATYLDHTVFINGNIVTRVTLYAPYAEYVTLNGVPWSFSRCGEYITLGEARRVYLPIVLKNPCNS